MEDGAAHPSLDQALEQSLSTDELRQLARKLVDLNEVVLIGFLEDWEFRLECHDSTTWTIACLAGDAEAVSRWFERFSPLA